jgi:hypothetical protein
LTTITRITGRYGASPVPDQHFRDADGDRLRGDIGRTRDDLERLEHEAVLRHLHTLDRGSIRPELPGHDRVPQRIDRLRGRDRGIGLGL